MTSKSSKLILKKNKKLDKIYHPETGLVFKSASERLVIGRIVNDEFISLDNDALELCEQHNFKYDESLVETTEEGFEEEAENTEETRVSSEESKMSEEVSSTQEECSKQPVATPDSLKDVQISSETEIKNNSEVVNSDSILSSIITRFSKELSNLVDEKNKELMFYKNKLSETENQLEQTKKDLENLKKKMKGVLAAMQEQL